MITNNQTEAKVNKSSEDQHRKLSIRSSRHKAARYASCSFYFFLLKLLKVPDHQLYVPPQPSLNFHVSVKLPLVITVEQVLLMFCG